VLQGEVSAHDELPRTAAGLARWTKPDAASAIDPDGRFVWSPDGDALVNFGRHRGQRLANVIMEAPAYVDWVSRKPEFSTDVRRIAAVPEPAGALVTLSVVLVATLLTLVVVPVLYRLVEGWTLRRAEVRPATAPAVAQLDAGGD
jgi:hypothetical protein